MKKSVKSLSTFTNLKPISKKHQLKLKGGTGDSNNSDAGSNDDDIIKDDIIGG